MNNFKKYGFLVAIIFSVLLHLVIIKNFSFSIFKSTIQDGFNNMQVTLIKPLSSEDGKNLSNKKKLPPKNSVTIIDSQGDVTNKVVTNKQKIIKLQLLLTYKI